LVAILEIALIFAAFAYEGGWPPPDPNEPHYLCKARHYWQPDWCPRDFFLNSHDTHLVFYTTVGALAHACSLPAAAWIGRLLTFGVMAVGWRRLSFAVLPRPGWSILSACLFAALNYRFHMAGEWVIGGFEAKGFAYALMFFGLAEFTRGRWNVGWTLLGAASALHVLVGGWSVVAMLGAWALLGEHRPSLPSMLPGLLAGGLLSLAGLAPALTLTQGQAPEIVSEAYQLYVYERLPHHLWPARFAPMLVERFLMLSFVWIALCAFVDGGPSQRVMRRFVTMALAIALAGWVISWFASTEPALVASLLRFYWFRLSDAALPIGVSLAAASWLATQWNERTAPAKLAGAAIVAGVLAHLCGLYSERSTNPAPRADGPSKVYDYADWRDACAWIVDNTPSDALFLTPRTSQTFKWYSGRSEVVTWKDIPQDAADLVRWWHRMLAIHGTGDPTVEGRFYDSLAESSVPHLVQVAREYEVDYLVTAAEPLLPLELVFENDSYAVYDLRSVREE
jgi:hypothetical protein